MNAKYKRQQPLQPINETQSENSRFTDIKKTEEKKYKSFGITSFPWEQHQYQNEETKPTIDNKDTVVINSPPKTMIEPLKDRLLSQGATKCYYDNSTNRLYSQYASSEKAHRVFNDISSLCESPVYKNTKCSIYDHSVMNTRSKYNAPDVPTPTVDYWYKIVDFLFNW